MQLSANGAVGRHGLLDHGLSLIPVPNWLLALLSEAASTKCVLQPQTKACSMHLVAHCIADSVRDDGNNHVYSHHFTEVSRQGKQGHVSLQ